jgi:hypothetical protein
MKHGAAGPDVVSQLGRIGLSATGSVQARGLGPHLQEETRLYTRRPPMGDRLAAPAEPRRCTSTDG